MGVFSTVGDIMMHVGGYHEYHWEYHDKCGDIMNTVGGYL